MSNTVHLKSWGNEVWLCNNSHYCGKLLNLLKGRYCSFHYHKLKTEDFYILKGSILLDIQYKDSSKRELLTLQEGDSIHLEPGTIHRFIGIEDSTIIETSTQHFEEDSYRLEPSYKEK